MTRLTATLSSLTSLPQVRLAAFLLAVCVPILLNKALPPMVTHTNEMAAVFGWGLVLSVVPAAVDARRGLRAAWPVLVPLLLCMLACTWTLVADRLPSDPALPTIGMLAIAALIVLHGVNAGLDGLARNFRPFAIALVAAGIGSAVTACVQVFAPQWADGTFISRTAWLNRASGSIGQPNHLADILVWALAALVPLEQVPRTGWRRRATTAALASCAVLMAVALVATSSRIGLLGVALLTAWGMIDRRLEPRVRLALLMLPLLVAAAWFGEAQWARARALPFSLSARVASGDISSFRFAIWHDALQLIARNPWTGVGWGNFNFAWALSPFGFRLEGPTNNAHDLVLQLAAETGVPCALAITALLLAGLWRGLRAVRRLTGAHGAAAACALVIVVQIGMHSLVEYPLWYTYLLYPAAWAWGALLGAGCPAFEAAPAGRTEGTPQAPGVDRARHERLWRAWGALVMICGLSAYLDYLTVSFLYLPDTRTPLPERIAQAQQSLLFGTRADFILVLVATDPAEALPEIRRSSRTMINQRLLYLWATALAEKGELDKARYLAERLHEYEVPQGERFFSLCDEPAIASAPSKPFQCTPSSGHFTWRDFR